MRARWSTEALSRGQWRIVVTELVSNSVRHASEGAIGSIATAAA